MNNHLDMAGHNFYILIIVASVPWYLHGSYAWVTGSYRDASACREMNVLTAAIAPAIAIAI